MLNIKDLEAKLDLALSAETPESLTLWLLQKRFGDMTMFGEGTFEELSAWTASLHIRSCSFESVDFKRDHVTDFDESFDYSRAA